MAQTSDYNSEPIKYTCPIALLAQSHQIDQWKSFLEWLITNRTDEYEIDLFWGTLRFTEMRTYPEVHWKTPGQSEGQWNQTKTVIVLFNITQDYNRVINCALLKTQMKYSHCFHGGFWMCARDLEVQEVEKMVESWISLFLAANLLLSEI